MIRVSCKDLQQVKNDPALYAANLVSNGKPQARRGMFSQWQTAARELHTDKLTIADASNRLSTLFSVWNDTTQNRNRQEFFHQALISYNDLFEKKGFIYRHGSHLMKWQLHKNIILGGYTPWIVSKGKDHFSYLFTEHDLDWESELRFPLLQQYVSKKIIECDTADMEIGVFSLESGRFRFRSFTEKEISAAKSETQYLFNKLNGEYLRRKSIS